MNTVQESHSVKELCYRFDNVGTIINEKWTDPILSIKYLMHEKLSYIIWLLNRILFQKNPKANLDF